MKATTKITAAKCLINDEKANSLWPWSLPFCTKSPSRIIIIRMIHYYSNSTCSSSITLSPLSSSPSHITHCLPFSQSQEGLIRTETTDISKSVNVRFQIEIECRFGDHILIVGDDPILGSWNPLNAIPFNWSEGHLWTLLLEMPIEKTFNYKFLLKRSSGEIVWQAGADRVFRPWETENVIVVSEEWETSVSQKIIEQQIIDENEKTINKTLVNDPLPIVAENIRVLLSDEHQTVNTKISSGLHKETGAHLEENPSSSATKNAVEDEEEEEEEESLVTCDQGPVLVPGLTVKSRDCEENIVNEHQKTILSDSQHRVEIFRNQEYHVYRFD